MFAGDQKPHENTQYLHKKQIIGNNIFSDIDTITITFEALPSRRTGEISSRIRAATPPPSFGEGSVS